MCWPWAKKGSWLLFAVTVIMTLLLMEGVLRISAIPKKNARFVCFHPVMGKVYCASTECTYTKAGYRRHLVVNSDGMVDREYPVCRPGELQRHFIPDDGHWTRHGHRYVAQDSRELLFSALSGQ